MAYPSIELIFDQQMCGRKGNLGLALSKLSLPPYVMPEKKSIQKSVNLYGVQQMSANETSAMNFANCIG